MISEVDLRDWDRVDIKLINDVIQDGTYLNERGYIWDFISQVEALKESQLRKIPKLERE